MSFSDLVGLTDRAVRSLLGGESIAYAPAVGSPVTVTGIFDELYVLAKGSEAAFAGVEANGPSVFLQLSDLPVDPESDDPTLTIRSIAYRVVERRRDDMGGIVLVLRKV